MRFRNQGRIVHAHRCRRQRIAHPQRASLHIHRTIKGAHISRESLLALAFFHQTEGAKHRAGKTMI